MTKALTFLGVLVMAAVAPLCAGQQDREFDNVDWIKPADHQAQSTTVKGLLLIEQKPPAIKFISNANEAAPAEVIIRCSDIQSMRYQQAKKRLIDLREHPEAVPIGFLMLFKVTEHYLVIQSADASGPHNYKFRLDNGTYSKALASARTQAGRSIQGFRD